MNSIFSPENKKNIIYGLLIVLLLVASGSLALLSGINPQVVYLLVQTAVLFVAIVHSLQIYKMLPHLQVDKIQPGFLFTIVITFLSAVALIALFFFLQKSNLAGFAATLILFPFPFLINRTYYLYMNIPTEEYKRWYYPVTEPNPPTDISRFLDISFEFPKKENETSTNFKVKAPVGMPFGELFHLFLAEYNEKHADSPVEYRSKTGKVYGWLFYIKNAKTKKKDYLDPDDSFGHNAIQDRDVVFAERD